MDEQTWKQTIANFCFEIAVDHQLNAGGASGPYLDDLVVRCRQEFEAAIAEDEPYLNHRFIQLAILDDDRIQLAGPTGTGAISTNWQNREVQFATAKLRLIQLNADLQTAISMLIHADDEIVPDDIADMRRIANGIVEILQIEGDY